MEKAFLTAKEVQQIINLGRTKTYELIRAGNIPKVMIEGCLRVPASALRDWITANSAIDTTQTPELKLKTPADHLVVRKTRLPRK